MKITSVVLLSALVAMNRYDRSATGANTSETLLNTTNVNPAVSTEARSHEDPARDRKTFEPPSMAVAENSDPGRAAEPTVAPPPASPAPRSTRPSLSGSTPDIGDEIATIEAARRAFDRGSGREGLAIIDRYLSDHPRGALVPEATVLRIEGLVLSGEKARAKAVGEAFLRAHPKSPHVQRVRSLIGPASP